MKITHINANFQEVYKDGLFRWVSIASILLIFITGVLTAIFWSRLPPTIPLLYSLPWGEEQLVTPEILLLFLGGILLVTLINLLLTALFKPVSDFYAKILIFTTLSVSLFCCVTVIQILLLVT